MSNEIASAYITLLTKMPGVKKDIENELDKVDGTDAGGKIGEDVSKGIGAKQAAIAGAFGGIFASLTNMAAGAIGNLFADAVAQSDATDKFASTLNFAGLDTAAVEAATAASKAYADSTVYDLGTIQNTTAQLAANGIANYSELTEAAGNLNAVAGGNADTFSSVAMMLTQTAGQGKLTTENWNQLADAIPGASGKLQEALANAGAYTGNFRDAMAEGQITADEFNAAILELGSQPVAVEAAASVTTMEGATGNLAAAITGRLAEAFDVIKPVIAGVTAAFGDFISNSDVFIPVIGGLATAQLVALAPAIWAAVTATWAFTVALLANPVTWIIIGIAALVAAIIALAMHWDEVVAWVSEVWAGFIAWISDVINGFVGWWNGIWASVGQWFTDVWNGIVLAVQIAWNLYISFITGAILGFLGWWNGIWGTIGNVFRDVWSGLGSFVEGIWSGIVDGVRWYVNSLIGLINGIIDGVNVLIGGAGALIGVSVAIPNIPELAAGGVITASPGGTIARIGEAGRDEAVIPLPDDWRQNGFGGSGVTRDDLRRFAADIVGGIQGLRSVDARAADGVRARGYDGSF